MIDSPSPSTQGCWVGQMAASINWGVHFLGVLRGRALLFGVYIGVPDVWKLPNLLRESREPLASFALAPPDLKPDFRCKQASVRIHVYVCINVPLYIYVYIYIHRYVDCHPGVFLSICPYTHIHIFTYMYAPFRVQAGLVGGHRLSIHSKAGHAPCRFGTRGLR